MRRANAAAGDGRRRAPKVAAAADAPPYAVAAVGGGRRTPEAEAAGLGHPTQVVAVVADSQPPEVPRPPPP